MPEICVSLAVGSQGLDIVLLGHDLKNKHQDTRVQRKIKLVDQIIKIRSKAREVREQGGQNCKGRPNARSL